MTFARPQFLFLLLLLPPTWLRMRKAQQSSRTCLALKCAAFAVLVVALADPWATMTATQMAITVLMDTSASMPRESLDHGQTILRDLVRQKSGAELRLITFGEWPQLVGVPGKADQVHIAQGVDPSDGMATNLEGALNLAFASFPSQGARRVLLISDGNENRGHALTAALAAHDLRIPIFTMPAGGTAPLPVTLDSVSSPPDVFAGERFTISLQLTSAQALSARMWLSSGGGEIGSKAVSLHAGSNAVDMDARIAPAGAHLIEVHLATADAEQVLFSRAVTVRLPHILYVTPTGESSSPLLDTLKRAHVDVQMTNAFPEEAPAGNWDAVVLDNYPDHELFPKEDEAIEKYVYGGGGLIFIAGDKNAKLAEKLKTQLDKLLPVRAAPPPEKPIAVVLVLDKSGSMNGPKIEMAREAARASITTLRPSDKIGVISFDETFNWVIPLGPATDIAAKTDLIGRINANGGTKIYQAVQAGFDAIVRETATRKHIILLTDGVSTPGTEEDYPRLEKQATEQHVTISTIGVGDYINRDMLDDLAVHTQGKSHFVENPDSIPQIINGEVRSQEDLAIQERSVHATRVRPVEFADGVDFKRAPALLGFVQAEAKPGSETILRVDGKKPLLVRWRYGLGRVIAFMSDAKSRWAAPWVRWEAFGVLWPQMVRDISHRDRAVRAGVRPGEHPNEVIVFYDVLGDRQTPNPELAGRRNESGAAPHVLVQTPGEPSRPIALEETAPGHYEARIASGRRGLYRIVSGNTEMVLPEAGFYRDSEETRPQTVNLALLSEISRVSGGRVRPSMDQLFAAPDAIVREPRPLWPYGVLLALVLNFIELALRKGFFERSVGLQAFAQAYKTFREKHES